MPLIEPPHLHAVCRGCGRIVEVVPMPDDLPALFALTERRPAGWSFDAMTVAFTGLCARCRPDPSP
jgi:Fe2+ or Zn2+ uptake regulation protein